MFMDEAEEGFEEREGGFEDHDDGDGNAFTAAPEAAEEGADENEDKPRKRPRTMRPQPKLNEQRLTDPATGIPQLLKVFENWKYDKRKDEFDNLDDILVKFEHWAHCLFPKMKFSDFVDRVEHLGHKRAVQNCLNKIRLGMPLTDEDFEREAREEAEFAEDNEAVPTAADLDAADFEDDEDFGSHVVEPETVVPSEPAVSENVEPNEISDEQRRVMEEKKQRALELRRQKAAQQQKHDENGVTDSLQMTALNTESSAADIEPETHAVIDEVDEVDPDLLAQMEH